MSDDLYCSEGELSPATKELRDIVPDWEQFVEHTPPRFVVFQDAEGVEETYHNPSIGFIRPRTAAEEYEIERQLLEDVRNNDWLARMRSIANQRRDIIVDEMVARHLRFVESDEVFWDDFVEVDQGPVEDDEYWVDEDGDVITDVEYFDLGLPQRPCPS